MKQPFREAPFVLNKFYPISKLARIHFFLNLTSNKKQHSFFLEIWGKSSYIFDINKKHFKNEESVKPLITLIMESKNETTITNH
jgi:hypothetical protein